MLTFAIKNNSNPTIYGGVKSICKKPFRAKYFVNHPLPLPPLAGQALLNKEGVFLAGVYAPTPASSAGQALKGGVTKNFPRK